MQKITAIEQFDSIQGNTVVGRPKKMEGGSSVTFRGSGNVVVFEDGVTLGRGNITFNGDNSVLYISSSRSPILANISLQHATTVFIGRDNYFNATVTLVCSEGKNIILGSDNLLSHGVMVRVADPHLLYDVATEERINDSASVLIGDHVWVGQDVLLLKGAEVGSGAVLAARSVVGGRTFASNCVWGGVPARLLRQGVFFTSPSVHAWTPKETEKHRKAVGAKYIFREKPSTLALADIDSALAACGSGEERLAVVRKLLVDTDGARSRFARAARNAEDAPNSGAPERSTAAVADGRFLRRGIVAARREVLHSLHDPLTKLGEKARPIARRVKRRLKS